MKKKSLILFFLFLFCASSCNQEEHVHNWSYIDYDETYHYLMCKDDNSHIEKQEHNYVLENKNDEQEEYKCSGCGRKKIVYLKDSEKTYTLKVKEEKYLKEKLSEATSIYYKSDENGNFGNDKCIFIDTIIPSEYEELEYITLNGYQYIDSEYTFNSNDYEIEIKVMLDTTKTTKDYASNNLFGVGKKEKGWTSSGFVELLNNNIYAGTSTYSFLEKNYFNTINDYKLHITSSNYKLYIDNILSLESDTTNILYDGSTYIGNMHWIDNSYNYNGLAGNIYSCKLTDTNNIVRNYVPVRKIDGSGYGLYDLVTNSFHKVTDIDYTKIDFIKGKEVANQNALIPSDYRQIEYIQSTAANYKSSQFIDTGIYFDPCTDSYDITFSTDKHNQNGMILSCWDVNDYFWLCYYHSGSTIRQYYSESGIQKYLNTDISTDYNGKINVKYQKGQITANGEVVENANKISEGCGNKNLTLFLFYPNYGEGMNSDYNFEGKLYELKLYKSDVLVRHFIPVYEVSTSYAGLYDIVNQKFYPNGMADNKYKYGPSTAHVYDDGIIISNPELGNDGVIEYTCLDCGHKKYESIEALAYEVTINKDEHVKSVKALISSNKDDIDISSKIYTRNKNTYNYSAENGMVKLLIDIDDGYEIDKIHINDEYVNIYNENGIYYIENITSNIEVNITTSKKEG